MKAAPEGVFVTDSKIKTLHLISKSDEHIEPFNLAMRQLDSLHKWNDQNADSLLKDEDVLQSVRNFHPDQKYDPQTRADRCMGGNKVHLSGLWEFWERCLFSPDELKSWARVAAVQGQDKFLDLSAVDHRKTAMIASVRLAAYEGGRLRFAIDKSPQDIAAIWRHLYWFTRFFKAWGNICSEFTPSQYANLEAKAEQARAWKKKAWDYYKSQIPTDKKIRTIAANFLKLNKGIINTTDLQKYLNKKIELMGIGKVPNKKTVG